MAGHVPIYVQNERQHSMTTTSREDLIEEIRTRTGLDEARIERVVHAFYRRVRADAVLGPIFAAEIAGGDWPAHLERMVAFWSSVALMSGRYHGRPMQAHAKLAVEAAHFDRWLELFRATAQEIGPPEAAAHLIERAERIAMSLESGIGAMQGRSLGRGVAFQLPA
jgi:hemoglobin